MPDEAQYWTWSQALSFGYYSKPPLIAWQIASGCTLFGNTELGVRFASVILGFFLSLGIYFLAKGAALDRQKAFWAAIAFTFCPLGIISSFLATTDCGFVLFWTLACLLFIKQRSLYEIGLIIAVGALWKWTVYLVWAPMLIYALVWKRGSVKEFFGGIVLSLLGLVPSVVWNVQHDWATFRHVFSSVDIIEHAAKGAPLEFLGAQAALVSPLLFLLLVWATIKCAMSFRIQNRDLQFCFWTFVTIFLLVFCISLFKRVPGNWAVCAYPTGFIVLFGMVSLISTWQRLYVQIAIGLSIILLSFVFALPYIQKEEVFNIPWRFNPWRQGLGWSNLDKKLLESGYDPNHEFLFSDRYQWTSILSFYGPQQKRAYFLNLHELRKNQFSYWPSMSEECLGKDGWFVEVCDGENAEEKANLLEIKIEEKLKRYFLSVEKQPQIILYKLKNRAYKIAILFYCKKYNGTFKESTHNY